ncbi:hypothetical protein IE81DRAFT_161316 [Ceraceosorus guamensis]|uniref:FAD-binding FR-type domain-containing protein n=1 Tax=Ceraceosorus guamensis TaxID=1522189 RepID=A0A316VW81_9BASI|nr:hypothetical protein IE81DRAFT_161316 [Ceraceosorus guamensis]PWN41702.1 hypothetical protein IE81DRAFT_161316 [Ceraceosorus guamensis]
MPAPTAWHAGELAAQEARGYEDYMMEGPTRSMIEGLPDQMRPFLSQLSFLPVTTLDEDGRPWGSILAGSEGQLAFLEPLDDIEQELHQGSVRVRASMPPGTPALRAIRRATERKAKSSQAFGDQDVLCSAVGVMLENRRRNKFEGRIVDVQADEHHANVEWTWQMSSTLGNCPKYINIRRIVPSSTRQAPVLVEENLQPPLGTPMPTTLLDLIGEAEMCFLHTKHSGSFGGWNPDPDRLGCNIRGGPRGFLRSYFDEERGRTAIVLPDWSGNRMMQSYGNVTHDGLASLSIPVWGMCLKYGSWPTDALYLTGQAEVLAGEEVRKLIRGVAGALRIWVTGWVYIKNALPLAVDAREAHQRLSLEAPSQALNHKALLDASLLWSPYNPPVRLLASEKPSLMADDAPLATLIKVRFASDVLATFTWSVDSKHASTWAAGRHIVLDAHAALDSRVTQYQHMSFSKGGEKDLNDDGVRSWTITACRPGAEQGATELDVTLRRVPRGGVTPGLFHRGKILNSDISVQSPPPLLKLPLMGIEGQVILPLASQTASDRASPLVLTYLVAGIGFTPLLAHLSHLRSPIGNQPAEVLVVLATRATEAAPLLDLLYGTLALAAPSHPLVVTIHLLLAFAEDEERNLDLPEPPTAEMLSLDLHLYASARLTATSLKHPAIPIATTDDSTRHRPFLLPRDDVKKVKQSDLIVVCGAPRFDSVAKLALTKAGVEAGSIKSESFAF